MNDAERPVLRRPLAASATNEKKPARKSSAGP
jgi:hypothetical protein